MQWETNRSICSSDALCMLYLQNDVMCWSQILAQKSKEIAKRVGLIASERDTLPDHLLRLNRDQKERSIAVYCFKLVWSSPPRITAILSLILASEQSDRELCDAVHVISTE